MRRFIAVTVATVLLILGCFTATGCMNPEQKKAWDALTVELLAIQEEVEEVRADHKAGKLSTIDFMERMAGLVSRKDSVTQKMTAVKDSGVKWYHVLYGLVITGLGLYANSKRKDAGLVGNVAGVLYSAIEEGGDGKTKAAVARAAPLAGAGLEVASKITADVKALFPKKKTEEG